MKKEQENLNNEKTRISNKNVYLLFINSPFNHYDWVWSGLRLYCKASGSRNNTKYKGISPDAKTVTLELYVNKEEKNRTTYKKYETGTEDTYGEGVGRVYESDEDPLDLYSPVEGKIEIKLRW